MAEKKTAREAQKKHAHKDSHAHGKGASKAGQAAPKERPSHPTDETVARKGKKTLAEIEAELRSLEIVKHALVTEKAVNMIDSENKLTFIVDANATKPLVKKSVEELYGVKVNAVNIVRDMKARKKAIVTIDKKFKADDVATKLGVI